jgi:anti-anti-sigma regulatory factor
MLAIHTENMNELAVVECKGRITRSEDVFRLRNEVLSQDDSQTIALDLSGVNAIGGGGLGMLAYLQHWADANGIEMKLCEPSQPVVEGLMQNRSIGNFKIASFHEMMDMLLQWERRREMLPRMAA